LRYIGRSHQNGLDFLLPVYDLIAGVGRIIIHPRQHQDPMDKLRDLVLKLICFQVQWHIACLDGGCRLVPSLNRRSVKGLEVLV